MTEPVHVVAVLEARGGDVDALRDYERKVLPIAAEHGGQLLVAFVPEGEPAKEVHVLRFSSRASLDAYRQDARVVALGKERAAAVTRSVVLVETQPVTYVVAQ